MIGGVWSDLGVVEMWENSGNMVYQNAENLRPQTALIILNSVQQALGDPGKVSRWRTGLPARRF